MHPRPIDPMFRSTFAAVAVALFLTLGGGTFACSSPNTIPGTEVPDTPEHRALLQVLERYRTGFVRKDAAAVLATAHVTYHDEAGTEDPSDDLNYDELGPLLRRRFDQLDTVRFTLEYIEVSIHGDRATVRVWMDASFRLKPFLGLDDEPRPQPKYASTQDYAEFELLREGRIWLITKGL